MKTFVIVCCILLTLSSTSIFAQTNVSGSIGTNTRWSLAGSPYITTGDVSIPSGITLTIDSGVVVRFQAGQSMYVRGTLTARKALFTSSKDTSGGSPEKGDWNRIQISDGSGAGYATFDTCQIRYGGTTSYPSDNASVYVYWGTAKFTGCDITVGRNYGIMFNDSGKVIINNSNVTSCEWPFAYIGAGSLVFNGTNNLSGNNHNGILMRIGSNSNALVFDTVAIPYVFWGDYYVNSGGSLTIASSDILKFTDGAHLMVDGTLIAKAAVGQKIYFTSYVDDNQGGDTNGDGTATAPHSSQWGGVFFRETSVDSACVMRRCNVTFGGYYQFGGITMSNASPTIDSCVMANNYYGAMLQNVSNPVFSNNTIGSSEMVPIAMSYTSNPVFTNNSLSFSDNRYDAIGLLGSVTPANGVLPIRSVTSIPNITYLLLENLVVQAGNTFTVNKGVVIKAYSSGHRIIVQGKLIANATADSVIVITSASDDGFGNPFDTNRDGTQTSPQRGDWGGITFEATSDTNSILNNCIIKYGSLPWTYYNTRNITGGEITTVNASPIISNCQLKDVSYGIYAFQSSNPKISNTSIINTQYTPIAISVSANPTLTGLSFTNTSWTGLGIIGEELGFNGTIKQRNVAGYTNITYVLLDDLTINSGTYVSVDPGVVIKSNGAGIFVNGGFKAKGTVAKGNVVFTSLHDDNYGNPFDSNNDGAGTSPARGDWSTIRFQAMSDDSYCILDSCVVKFAGGPTYSGIWGGVTFSDASSILSHSLISDSYAFGVRCEGSSTPTVDRVDIRNCGSDPLAMSLKSNPVFTNITFASNGTKGIRILEGTLSSNATLYKRDVAGINNIAYIVTQLTISPNAVLTIEPGVVIKFPNVYGYWCSNYNEIRVQGALVADGTATQKIVFTSIKDDANGGDTNNDGNTTTPERGDWFSIRFDASSADSLNSLVNCQIRYAGSGSCQDNDAIYKSYGAVRVFDSYGLIDSCSCEHSATTGIAIYGSGHPTIRNCQINNITVTPISLSLFSNPTFSNNFALNVGYMALAVVPETYSVNATVPKRNFGGYNNITYYLFDNNNQYYLINSGTVITIPSGVVFKGGGFTVNGALVINGTPTDKVVFTDPKDDQYGNPGDTNGDGFASQPTIMSSDYPRLVFTDVSDDSISAIRNAVFRYVQHGISFDQASPQMTNCIFDKDDWGVRLNGVSQPTVDSCTFNNLTYAPIQTSLVSYPRSTNGNSISGTTYRAIGILEETLVQDVTLVRRTFAGIPNIPYVFKNYTVGTGAILTIQSGITMKFFPGTTLTVMKGLIAEGGSTPDSAIVFADVKDDFYAGDTNGDSSATNIQTSPGTWLGIIFSDESLDPYCRLKNCIVRDALMYCPYWCSEGTGITMNSASPTITYCTITNNRYGVVTNGASNPKINYCDIYQNTLYGVRNADRSFNFDARYNWWGNNSGPTHSGNPAGTGDIVTDSVNYTPFRTAGAQQPIAGDVSLNGIVQAYDASLILKYVVDSVSNPLSALQKHTADVSGQMGVTSYDASLILQYVVGNITHFPVETGTINQPMLNPKLLVTSFELGNVAGNGGGIVIVPMKAEMLHDFASADIDVVFDPSLLTPTKIDLAAGANGMIHAMSISGNHLKIGIASSQPKDIEGDLLYISFNVAKEIPTTTSTSLTFSSLMVNENSILTTGRQGEITLNGKPATYALEQNYPNPFNPITTITYQLPEDAVQTKVTIYNTLGELVRTLVNDVQNSGTYTIQWDGTNDAGISVSSGLYYYRLDARGSKNYSNVKKMLFVK